MTFNPGSNIDMTVSDIFKKSIIVVAHPDDEILWFSSLLKGVDHIMFCFLDEIADPDFGARRRKAMARYPLKNSFLLELSSLGLLRPESFVSPRFNQYGIELVGRNDSIKEHKKKYKENYHELRRELPGILGQYQNVITHNPWGEYGHEEHVQVYQIINELKEKIGYNLWYSSYCSNRTINLLAEFVGGAEEVTLSTNGRITKELMELYEKNGCWTWYKDWHWPVQETFIRQGRCTLPDISNLRLIPFNLVMMPPSLKLDKKRSNVFSRFEALTQNILTKKKDGEER